MPVDVIEVTAQEMDALAGRINDALNDGLSLEPEDILLILQIVRQFAFMQGRLEGNETMKQRYLKLMGLVSSSETQDTLFKSNADTKKNTRTRKNRTSSKPKTNPVTVCHHQLEGLEKGQACPECEKGKLYKSEPASFIRVTGQPPLSAKKHIMEQFRCNLCGQRWTADLPEEVLSDGARQQKYGYSARSLMAISKFYMGSPYYRQENLQALFGMPVTASTIYDQCALLVDDVMPVFDCLKQHAANAYHFHIDDTGNRILDQSSMEKPNRSGKGTRQRTGIYTSALIATDSDEHQVALFQTNIGHAGEWIDEVLRLRDSELDKPILMSDALSSNMPTVVDCHISLCGSHSRRKFTDIVSHYPEAVEHVVKRYALIWQNNTQATADGLSLEQRQQYHKQHSLPVMEELKAWFESKQQAEQFEGNSSLGRAIDYFLKHYDGLTAFCRIPGARIDNNLVEMIIKLIARGRKNAYFYKSLAGAKVGDVLTSLIATCELSGINVYDYLVALQQNRWSVSQNPQRWLPWTFQTELTKAKQAAA
jgi:transposase